MPTQFTAQVSDHELYEIVRTVALALDPHEPWSVSTRAFDGARKQHRSDALSADAICKRLRYPWPDLLALVFDEDRDNEHAVAIRSRRALQDALDLDQITAALHIVEARDGHSSESPTRYAVGREELVAQDQRAWAHSGRLDQVLPTAGQIEYSLRRLELNWDNARESAGLTRRRPGGVAGVPVVDAIDRFIDELGFVPNGEQIIEYAKAKGFSLQQISGPYKRYLTEVRRRRREQGVSMPRKRRPGRLGLALLDAAGGARAGPLRRRREWTYEECIEGLVIALRKAKGRALTQRLLRELAKGNPDIPTYSVVERAAKREKKPGFKEMRAEAARRLNSGDQTPQP